MKKILYALYQPYKWLIFIPLLAISTLIFGICAVVLSYITKPSIASLVSGKSWARFNATMTPIRIKISGKENIKKNQSYVIVSNHQSQYDIFVLYGWLGVDFKWVMKQELRKTPIIGFACEKIGHIFIDRSNHASAVKSLDTAKKNIINGTSVIFFPEGTRSKDGTLGEFKKGAFNMAIDLELPILPITIIGTKDILPSNTIKLFPGKVQMKIHKPIESAGFNSQTIQKLMQKTHSAIQAGFEQ